MIALGAAFALLPLQGQEALFPPDNPPPASLRLWVDAQSVDGHGNETLTDGASVTSWNDKSAFDRATFPRNAGPTFTRSGTFGKPAVRFTPPNFLAGNGPLATNFPLTVFAVFATVNSAQAAVFGLGDFASPDFNEVWIGTSNNVAAVHRRADPAAPAASTNVVNDGRPHTVVARFVSSSSVLLYVDGQLARADTTLRNYSPSNYGYFTFGGVFDGSNETVPYTGDISEIRVYDRDFTDGERREIERRLFVKWIQRVPEITQQPQAVIVLAGGSATFNVAATSSSPLSYQWRRGSANLPGATGTSLTLTNLAREESGQYSVRVSNTDGGVDSAPAQLTVTLPPQAPTILAQPRNQSVQQGANVVLSVTAQGTEPITYQWRKNGTTVPSATSATLQFDNVAPASAGSYVVVVSNPVGSVTSIVAVLNVSATLVAPTITTAPRGEAVTIGATASLSVIASGSQPLAYQWRKNGQAMAGATSAQLTLPDVTANDAGAYTVTVSNGAGSVTSAGAILTVTAASAGQNSWTILVYGHADHTLSVSLVQDMVEMERVGSATGFNIVVQADFNATANHYGLLPAGLEQGVSRFLIQTNLGASALFSTAIQRLPELDLDDPANLTAFVHWGITNYPAARVGLILWNHGGQFLGFGGDQQDGTATGHPLLTAPIKNALTAALQGTAVQKFDFTAFDTCLMGGAECLGDFVGLTDTHIACPEIDYGPGWDYTATLAYLKRNPGVTPRNFASTEVEKWTTHHFGGNAEVDKMLGAHAAYDLTVYPAFQNAFFTFGPLLKQFANDNIGRLIDIRRGTTRYSAHDAASLNSATDYTDLGELARKLAVEPLAPTALQAAASTLVSSITNMIINKALGTLKQNAVGLSVHLPLDGLTWNEYYGLNIFATNRSWLEIFPVIANAKALDSTAPVVTASGGTARSVTRGAKTSLTFQVEDTSDLNRVNGYLVSRTYTGDANQLVYLGQLFTTNDTTALDSEFAWSGTAPIIWGADSTIGLYLGGFLDPADPSIMTSYAEYLPPGEEVSQFVILLTDLSGENPRIVAVLDGEADSLAPIGIELEAGGLLTPVYYVEYEFEGDPETFESYSILADESLIIPADGLAGMEVALAFLSPADYTVSMQAEDDFGNISESIEFTVTIAPEPLSLTSTVYSDGFIEVSWFDPFGDVVLDTTSDLSAWDFYIPNDYIDFDGDWRSYLFVPDKTQRFFRLSRP